MTRGECQIWNLLLNFLVFSSVLLGFSKPSYARPEYANKEKLSCVACHVNPWGGGPRNIFGKVYGSRGLGQSKLSSTDVVYGDMRFIGYLPTQPTHTASGAALMTAAVTGNVKVLDDPSGSEMRGVLTYNIASLGGSTVRDAYIRWQIPQATASLPMQFLVGRFHVPFGLLTDEHRTYTRIQTNTTLNNFDVGGGVAGQLSSSLHYDVALVNDFQTGGSFSTQDLSWGAVVNFRWNPLELPFMLGASGNYQRTLVQPQPYALSVYGGLSVDRLTQGAVSGSILIERVDAKNWNNPSINSGMVNPSLSQFFIPSSDAAYLDFVRTASSLGYYSQVKYNLTKQWTFFYKLDFLSLDRNYQDDAYFRHGFGVEAYLNSNLILNARYEKAGGMRPEIAESNVLAAQDDFFAMLRLWI